MDTVFVNSKGYLDVVHIAKTMPHASILELENVGADMKVGSVSPVVEDEWETVTAHPTIAWQA